MRWVEIFLQFLWHNYMHVKIIFVYINILSFQIYPQILVQFFF